jgi:hypothetical protein
VFVPSILSNYLEKNNDIHHLTPNSRNVQTMISRKTTDEKLRELIEAHEQITNDEGSKELYPSP